MCKKWERVRCELCEKEIVVKLNVKEVDGQEERVLNASEIGTHNIRRAAPGMLTRNAEEALVERYVELIITSHAEDCLWRQRGCDGRSSDHVCLPLD